MDNFGVYVQLCLYRFRCALSTLTLMNKFAVAIYLRASSNFRLTHRAFSLLPFYNGEKNEISNSNNHKNGKTAPPKMPYENVECSGLSVKFMCGGDAVNKRNELTRANWFLHTMRTLAH